MKKASRRRVPAQDRSKERVARILDAAAHEFAERGVEASTIESIADRAQTSVGSIYQFFPNKLALYEAIGGTYLQEVRALFAVLVSDDAVDSAKRNRDSDEVPWRQVISATIDAFSELHRSSITFRAIWSNITYSRRFFSAGQAMNAELAERAEMVFGRMAKHVPAAKRRLLATVTIETMSALLLLSADKPRSQAKPLLDEAKMLIQRYLEPYLD